MFQDSSICLALSLITPECEYLTLAHCPFSVHSKLCIHPHCFFSGNIFLILIANLNATHASRSYASPASVMTFSPTGLVCFEFLLHSLLIATMTIFPEPYPYYIWLCSLIIDCCELLYIFSRVLLLSTWLDYLSPRQALNTEWVDDLIKQSNCILTIPLCRWFIRH